MLLKREILFDALELLENVVLMEDDFGRKIFRVDSLSRNGHFYYCYFGVYYCTCCHISPRREYWLFNVLFLLILVFQRHDQDLQTPYRIKDGLGTWNRTHLFNRPY